MAELKGVSLNPDDFKEGGGLWTGVEGTIKGLSFKMWDYQGKAKPACAALLQVEDDQGVEYEQYLSCGGGSIYPSPDGKFILPAGTALNSGSNFALFVLSMINAGFPKTRIADDVSVFVGGKYYFERVAAPKRSVIKQPRADGKVFEDTILTVTKIISLPGDKAKGAVKGAKKGAPSPAVIGVKTATAASADGDDLSDTATMVVMEVLGNNPGVQYNKQTLAKDVFAALATNPDKAKIFQLVFAGDTFLSGGPWTYEDGIITG